MLKFKNMLDKDLIARRAPNTIKPMFSCQNKIYNPFSNIDKKDIKNLYHDLGLLETLFPLTRSCESLVDFEKHCGECWWCEERLWAFGKLS
jgi:7-cyano-7-deazaguanine synthase in queuosine biosynthesis